MQVIGFDLINEIRLELSVPIILHSSENIVSSLITIITVYKIWVNIMIGSWHCKVIVLKQVLMELLNT